MNYYNENDKKTAHWLRNLIAAKFIPNGHVDDRSIRDVTAADLGGHTQCHFFAGIGELRGIGNAIIPQVAARFVEAFVEAQKVWQPSLS